jgi:hypothetical protein
LLVVPLLIGFVTWKVCREISRQNAHPIQHPVGGVIVRTPTGGYEVLGSEEAEPQEAETP